MANDSITTVLSVVAWGTKLTFSLYDFAVANTAASQDVSRLAKEVNLLSQVLRQIGSRLKDDGSMPSPRAFDVVRAVLDQCQDCFREIENLVPITPGSRGSSRPGSYDGGVAASQQQLVSSRPGSYDGAAAAASPQSSYVMVASPGREREREDGVDWNPVVQARAMYLLAHLESLKLTMSVMLQTLYTARAIVWARYDEHQTAYEAMVVEKLQAESLVVEQQLALFRANRLYDTFRWQTSNAPLLLDSSPQSQALIGRDSEYGPHPRALTAYQVSSLANTRPSPSEMEDLSRIRLVSGPYVDMLLSTWTRMHIIEERYRIAAASSSSPPGIESTRQQYQQRNWQAPAVESDSEDDANGPRRPPRLNLSTTDPVLMHINEPQHVVSSPISAVPRSATLQPPGGPFSPQPSHSWGPASGAYFPQTKAPTSNTSRRRVSPARSPLASPRVSFSTSDAPPRVQTAFKPEQRGIPPNPQQPQPQLNTKVPPTGPPQDDKKATPTPTQQSQGIPYRLRINQWYWDYASNVLVESNARGMTPHQAIKSVSKDTTPITELFQSFVSREAIRKAGWEYTRVPRERILPNGRKVEEQCYCVDGALRPEEVQKLVDRTRRIRGETGDARASSRAPPPFERANTAPVLGNKFRETHAREVEAATRRDREKEYGAYPSSSRDKMSSASNTSDEDSPSTYHHKSDRSSSSRPRSKSRHRHDSPRGDDEYYREHGGSSRARSRDDRGEKRKSGGGGNAKMQTATKIAAGAGLVTLLDGLPEMLSYL